VVAAVCVLGLGATAVAQETTGGLSGAVVMKSDQSVLPGAMVEAVHVPTGTRYAATTRENGRFDILNVRVGGPYTITATISGFKQGKFDGVTVALGERRELVFELELEAVYETVEVTAEAMPLISPDRMGSGSSVPLEQLSILPTVRRQIQDFARLNPYVGVDPADPTGTRIAVGGKNNRYNTIQIDGAVNNDLFGLADTGTPGGQTDTQPISLDSLQELQVVVSPYDIKQGGFTGGGINAITRSGSNDFHGSVYGSTRDESYVSDQPGGLAERPIAEFKEDQYGLRFGGRILRDKLFFFASAERNTRSAPTGVSADGSTATQYNNPAQAAEFRQLLIDRYSYDPGGLGDFNQERDSDLAFLRFDFNFGPSHQMTLRHNYVDASSDVVADRSTTRFRFETAIYAIADETNSTVLQLNSVFGDNSFNVGRVGYQTIRDSRTVPVIFPTIDIGPVARQPQLSAGTERFSGANALDQDILEITDDFTLVTGDHAITIGTHNEFFDFANLFLSDFYGWYRFSTLDDFKKGLANEYSITFANGDDPRRATEFSARQWGLYAGDQWRLSKNFTLTLGLRADLPEITDNPSYNPKVDQVFGIDTSEVPDDMLAISPRVGFNWALGGKARHQLRGGVGVFAGRTPFVWISNAFGNTGVETTTLSARGAIPFVADPYNQPKNFPPGTSAVSVDAIDPDFQFPRVMRATVGYDREMAWGLRGTAEVMYTQTIQDVYYQNLNKVATGTYGWDGRPQYKNYNSAFANVPYLTNTTQGQQKQITLMLEKRFDFGLYFNGSYSYMDAEAAFEGTSSRAISNWQFHPTRGDIYKPETSTSNWEIEDRFNFVVSQIFRTGPVSHNVALFYQVQSGTPFSVLIGTTSGAADVNGDGFNSNDLIFIPNSTNDFILRGATPEQWETFLSWTGLDAYRGEVVKKNASTTPWNRTLDFHYDLELPIKVIRTQFTFDILNLLNLIDKDKGATYYVSNQTYTPIYYAGKDAATGKPIYQTAFTGALDPGRAWSIQDLRSRWQLKFGLRVSF
jgi:hypothetical protein